MTWRCKELWHQQPWYWPNSHTIFHHRHSEVEVDPSKHNPLCNSYEAVNPVTSPHRKPVMQPRLSCDSSACWLYLLTQWVNMPKVVVVARLSLSWVLIAAALSNNFTDLIPKDSCVSCGQHRNWVQLTRMCFSLEWLVVGHTIARWSWSLVQQLHSTCLMHQCSDLYHHQLWHISTSLGFLLGIHQLLMHKGLMMWKVWPCHDVIMRNQGFGLLWYVLSPTTTASEVWVVTSILWQIWSNKLSPVAIACHVKQSSYGKVMP